MLHAPIWLDPRRQNLDLKPFGHWKLCVIFGTVINRVASNGGSGCFPTSAEPEDYELL